MNFTFGIVTHKDNEDTIQKIIESIELQNIPNYEIIIVGCCKLYGDNIINIEFDESIKPMWITKKKNIITEVAKYENIVFMHDYIILGSDWYRGQMISGNDFDIRMDKIINLDGSRFRDWSIWPHNGNQLDSIIGRNCLLPYNITHLTKYMYISGSYWVAKKEIMKSFPLDENLTWGEGEDVNWSFRVRDSKTFNMNIHSNVNLLKLKDPAFTTPNEEQIKYLNSL